MPRSPFAAHPPGLSALFFVELWERFSYYGMRALLTLFMVAPVAHGGLGFSTPEAAVVYGNYTMAVYLLAIPGGYLADRFIGARLPVLLGGAIIALGHFALAVPHVAGFYAGLVLVCLGTGLFKPNISAMVGELYGPDDRRRDSGFTLFYMGINIGGLIAPLITGFLAESAMFKSWLAGHGFDPALSWHWGFAAAGIGMSVALAVFAANRRGLAGIGNATPGPTPSWPVTLGVLAACAALLAALFLSDREGFAWLRYLLIALPLAAIAVCLRREDLGGPRVAAIFVFFIAAMVFWAAFEQAGLSIALFAERLTDRNTALATIPAAWFQSLNPLFVILLAPVFATLWLRLGDRQPSTPLKFALGLALLALSFAFMIPAAHLTATGRVSPLWLVGLFLLQTMGELCLSPVGLSAMTRLAPARTVGLMLGVWFLGAAFGNKLSGILGAGFVSENPNLLAGFFVQIAAMVGIGAAAMLVLTPWVKRLMGDVASPALEKA